MVKKNSCPNDINPRILIVFKDNKVFTLETSNGNLFGRIHDIKDLLKKDKVNVQILYSLLKLKIEDYRNIVQEIESRTNEFERKTVDNTSSKFLHDTFHFRRELQGVSDNLWHFHQVLDQIMEDGEDLLNLGIDGTERSKFNKLHMESKYLCRKARNIRESLGALLELHINTVSYEMNNVMKAIAVITCLAIIPSVIGGILGVNLMSVSGTVIGFEFDTTEVVFLISSSMFLGIYTFFKMGWLR